MSKESSRNANPCLHLVLSASQAAWEDCMRFHKEGDTVLFLADGVMRLLQDDDDEGAVLVPGRYCEADLAARGLLALAQERGIDIFQDTDLGILLERHRHCMSWK